MIRRITKIALRKIGLRKNRNTKETENKVAVQKDAGIRDRKELIKALTKDPLNKNLHLKYADYASRAGNYYLAYAELKTAEALGAERNTVEGKLSKLRQSIPSLKRMSHNQYFRLFSLASEIINRAGGSNISVLDVGGGNGKLASFIPDASYCLAEPKVNGISGTNLPFADHSFDYVVSCHVLEHIPVRERVVFLNQLLSKAKRGVILLNPFYIKGTYVEERLKLIIKLTNSQWAKEHLDCTLPKIQDIEQYARGKGLEICIRPNGTMTTSMAFVIINYFAAKFGFRKELKELNTFFNEKFTEILDSKEYPNAYLIYLGWPEAKGSVNN